MQIGQMGRTIGSPVAPRQPAPNVGGGGVVNHPIVPQPRQPVLGSFKRGGTARKGGSYKLHGGERAMSKKSGERGGGRC